jgi:hypothetical protein
MKGMLVAYRGRRPSTIRVDQLDRYRKSGRCQNRSRHLYEGDACGLGPPPSGWTSWTGIGNQGGVRIGADTAMKGMLVA